MSHLIQFQKAKVNPEYPSINGTLSIERSKGDRAVLLGENAFYKWLRESYNRANEDSVDYDLPQNARFSAMKKAQLYLSVIKMFEAQVENALKQIYAEDE